MRTIMTLAILTVAACGGGEEACEDEGALRCTDYEVLEECTADGWVEADDCAAQGMMCHEEMGHCMDMTGSTMDM